jgi:hypothetical protein
LSMYCGVPSIMTFPAGTDVSCRVSDMGWRKRHDEAKYLSPSKYLGWAPRKCEQLKFQLA